MNVTDNELLQAIYSDMQSMKADMQTMKADMQTMKEDVQTVKEDVQMVKEDVQTVKEDVQTVKEDVQTVKGDVQTANKKITSIEMTLENETNRNISIVAEGHAILNRRLDEALKAESEREMLLIRVNRLENELRKIKEHLDMLEIA